MIVREPGILYRFGFVQPVAPPGLGLSVSSLSQSPTGEPEGGDRPVRFGGRGGFYLRCYPYPKVRRAAERTAHLEPRRFELKARQRGVGKGPQRCGLDDKTAGVGAAGG